MSTWMLNLKLNSILSLEYSQNIHFKIEIFIKLMNFHVPVMPIYKLDISFTYNYHLMMQ